MVDSTNARAAVLARSGVPHGTLVTADNQTAGRGRRGRRWNAPSGQALLLSLVLRRWDDLLALRAGLAAADLAGAQATVKWPNDVLVGGRKVAGVLAERRHGEEWVVLGVGVNAAVDVERLEPALQATAGSLGRDPSEMGRTLEDFLRLLQARLHQPQTAALRDLRARDALAGQEVSWATAGGPLDRTGTAVGIDGCGRLLVRGRHADEIVALSGGEVQTVRAATERH